MVETSDRTGVGHMWFALPNTSSQSRREVGKEHERVATAPLSVLEVRPQPSVHHRGGGLATNRNILHYLFKRDDISHKRYVFFLTA